MIKLMKRKNKSIEFCSSALWEEAVEDSPSDTGDVRLSGRRILICEDHPMNMDIIAQLLKRKGIMVSCAIQGDMAVEKFRESEEGYFDMLLMDIRMPLKDGLQVTREIRNMNRGDASLVPILAMTASEFYGDIQDAMEAGMNGYLCKPIKPEVLYQKLCSVFRHMN